MAEDHVIAPAPGAPERAARIPVAPAPSREVPVAKAPPPSVGVSLDDLSALRDERDRLALALGQLHQVNAAAIEKGLEWQARAESAERKVAELTRELEAATAPPVAEGKSKRS